MAENSKIEWTDHTFNPWFGCTHVSPGCEHCYAEVLMDQRYGRVEWGKGKARMRTSVANWRKPLAWNKTAAKNGIRARVFCSSLADVFDEEVSWEWRRDLFQLIDQCPSLDWLLLTKRPQRVIQEMEIALDRFTDPWFDKHPNVWIGTSVEDQRRADERIPHLLNVPALVRFLSCEPLLGPVDLSEMARCGRDSYGLRDGGIDWVICGGESGHGARPMHPDWARSLRDQCQAAGVAFHFKQWGEYQYGTKRPQRESDGSITFQDDGMPLYVRVGKGAAGRLLDGREWNEVPV